MQHLAKVYQRKVDVNKVCCDCTEGVNSGRLVPF